MIIYHCTFSPIHLLQTYFTFSFLLKSGTSSSKQSSKHSLHFFYYSSMIVVFITLESFVPDPYATLLVSNSAFLIISSVVFFSVIPLHQWLSLYCDPSNKSLSCPYHLSVDWWSSPLETRFNVSILISLT